jgi:hypothetical protein
VLPGAIITSSGTNPLLLHVSYTAGTISGSVAFSVDVLDNACPYYSIQSYAYTVNIAGRTSAGPDQIICGSQTASLNATGGNTFNWAVLSGPPMIIGTNFSCNPCASPVASPTATTIYEVTSNLSGGCTNKDTITVNVTNSFSFSAVVAASSPCVNQPRQLNINGLSPAGPGYNYSWSPSTYLDNSSIANPVAAINSPGLFTYTATVTNSSGCIKQDTVQIFVANSGAPQVSVFASDTNVCPGAVIQLSGVVEGASAICGTSSISCTSSVINTVGAGATSNTSSTYPAPYGNWYTSVKQQYLYTAAELNAAGIVAGKIDQLDFNVSTINGISTYQNYSLSIGCTSLNSFSASSSSFETGLFNVFPSQSYPVTVGWNPHVFTNSFVWDGISNIIVEVCMNQLNPGANYTTNSTSPNDATSYVSSIYSLSDASDQCSSAVPFIQAATAHPVIRLHHCSGGGDTANYVYSWLPSAGVSSPGAQITNASVTSAATYTLTVTDTTTGCFSNADQTVNTGGTNITVNGNVNYGGTAVSGFAKLFTYVSGVQMPMQDSVVINAGFYSFSNVPAGDYIIQATADTMLFPLAVPTYYNMVYAWDSANVVTLQPACFDTTTVDITMRSQPSLIGSNVISGAVIEGEGYIHAPGSALSFVDVFLQDNTTGALKGYTKTNSLGYYYFNDVPFGCYKVYVDIPGLNMQSTYQPCVSSNDTINWLNFVADSSTVHISNSILNISAANVIMPELRIYPNPSDGNFAIECYMPQQDLLSLEITNAIGERITTLILSKKQDGLFKMEIDKLSEYSSGLYFVKLITNHGTATQKLIITK